MSRRGRQPRQLRRGYRKPKFVDRNDAKWREEERLRAETEERLRQLALVYVQGVVKVLTYDHYDELVKERIELDDFKPPHGKEVGW